MTEIVPFEAEAKLDWIAMARAIEAGHDLPPAQVTDTFLYRGEDTLLNRSAWIEGLGIAVKVATIFPGNDGPSINGAVNLLSDADGTLEAVVDFHLVTKWKTAADSLLGAMKLARPDSREILIVGAGTFALRVSMIALLGRVERTPPAVERVLRFIRPAVLAALIAPAVILLDGRPAFLGPLNPRLVAGVVATLVAWKTSNVLLTIGSGMAVLWVLQALV